MSTVTGQRFRVDHVVIRTPGRDALVEKVARLSARPVLEGYRPGGEVVSRGVRFANGPFLDVFGEEAGAPALILQGPIAALEAVATKREWVFHSYPREAITDPADDQPWSMLMFRRGQGLLTQISAIEYAKDPAPWAMPAFSGPLYPPDTPPDQGARLRRVWLGAQDLNRAAADLMALGFVVAGPVASDFAPHAGTLFRGSRADLVLFPGPDGVARIDIDGREPQRVELTPDLALVCGEA
ncbi:hypothetical protein [Phenylobacterium sp.]|uniref:hypothetical protein n=1 Tax=Phenylobacterium sp. TaxID=1871053 RepID=UPI002715AB8A|nr:hypothetical protein [Phenylobacterium sp.]MDO8800530.1 hypothetical protein [Phenylobacterium sp.]